MEIAKDWIAQYKIVRTKTTTCKICKHNKYEGKIDDFVQLPCNHIFHITCLYEYMTFIQRNTCQKCDEHYLLN